MNEDQIFDWITNKMEPKKWYNIKKESVELIKNIINNWLPKEFELTFNKDFTRLKLTIWENNKPNF
jgi:hypothetical protein